MGRNPVETIMGAVVLCVAAFFIVFAYNQADLREVAGYDIQAHFSKVGGLSAGSDVRVAGIKVGSVSGTALDPQTFEAVLTMTIRQGVQLPPDTTASIASAGLLGGKYVKLEPGNADGAVGPGGRIENTQDFRSLEEMVGEIIFLATQQPGGGS